MLLVLAYLAFVSLGLPDGVLGVAWPSLRDGFRLRHDALGAASIAAGSGYVLSSFLSGRWVERSGVGAVLWISAALAGAGLGLHALAPAWAAFAAAALLVGLGSGAVDAALNAVVSRRYSARHVNWLHACYSAGAALGPLLMAASLPAWRRGYALLAGLLLALALLFAATRRRWGAASLGPAPRGVGDVFRHPLARLQIAVFFVYTGLEAALGAWAYTVLTESRGVPTSEAAAWVALYFGGIAAGRVLLGLVADRVGPDRLVLACAWAAAAGAGLFLFSGAGLALCGLALAPIFPCLMSRTPARLGEGLAVHAIGIQVSAATVGAALAPAVGGLLAGRFGPGAVGVEAAVLAALLALLISRLYLRSR